MKRIFTRAIIHKAAKSQQKSVLEATSVVLALILLSFGIAGFQTLFKKSTRPQHQLQSTQNAISVSNALTVEGEISKKNLLTYLFPDLRYTCSPATTKEEQILWTGTCRPVNGKHLPSYHLKIRSSSSPKKYKGFKLAKEIFYLVSKKEFKLSGQYSAFSFSTFLLGGGTFIKIPQHQKYQKKNPSTVYLLGLGLGLAFHIDKKLQINFEEIVPSIASVN
jgi:hypothetical protein